MGRFSMTAEWRWTTVNGDASNAVIHALNTFPGTTYCFHLRRTFLGRSYGARADIDRIVSCHAL